MTGGEYGYTVKEMIAMLEQRITTRLDRIETKLDDKVSQDDFESLERRIMKVEEDSMRRSVYIERFEKVEHRIDALSDGALSVSKVRDIISGMLRDSETRGWTNRERLMGVGIFVITIASFILNVWALH